MTTEDLRAAVTAAALTVRAAKVWPNGLGFDAYGWEYMTTGNPLAMWSAVRRWPDGRIKAGYGKTPQFAKEAATWWMPR